jgi:hypothetical protein
MPRPPRNRLEKVKKVADDPPGVVRLGAGPQLPLSVPFGHRHFPRRVFRSGPSLMLGVSQPSAQECRPLPPQRARGSRTQPQLRVSLAALCPVGLNPVALKEARGGGHRTRRLRDPQRFRRTLPRDDGAVLLDRLATSSRPNAEDGLLARDNKGRRPYPSNSAARSTTPQPT